MGTVPYKYRCLIAEDNVVERDWLLLLLKEVADIELVAVCASGMEALQYLQSETADIVFSDIDMPHLSGIDLLKNLEHPPVFIFTSSHNMYAAESFDLDVIDFVVKPVTLPRLRRAFSKAKEFLSQRTMPPTATDQHQQPDTPDGDEILIARTDDGLYKLQTNEIAFAESRANYSMLHMADGTSHLIQAGLKRLEEQLESTGFIRVHKNYIINWNLVTLIQTTSITVNKQHKIPIGDSYRKAIANKVSGHKKLERDGRK